MLKKVFGAALLAATCYLQLYASSDGPERTAIAPLVIAALIGAAASAATAAGSAAANGAATDAANAQNDKARRQQERMQKAQLAEQARQFEINRQAQAQQALGATYDAAAKSTLDRAAERQKSRAGLLNAFSQLMG
jgi:hypothetical protein